jgi:DNA-binding SARP family transcriptional activator/tetratricopeptide (TPR) repeat protein
MNTRGTSQRQVAAVAEDSVEFGLLGPLLVKSGGMSIQVSAGNQRVILAALLLRANEVVSCADLAEVIWEDRPPKTARVTLQNYVKRLRHALLPSGHDRIVTRPAGYQIRVDPGGLDVARFTELAVTGRAAARAQLWDEASARLFAALALWRGEPLADVSSQVLATTHVPRLAEMRLEAMEARIDADLHLGRHRELVPELQALAAAEPLRERVRELLMLALYRCGQQAAALATYRHARRQLIDDIGIEPGPALRALNQKILNSDPTLELPAPQVSVGPAASPGPCMLPTPVPGFTGRTAELAALSAMTGRTAPVLITAIGGSAGVGKTALAVHWAHEHADQFPDGQLYADLRGFGPADPLSPADALRVFLDTLRVPTDQIPATMEGRQALFRSLLADKKMLIILDNARDPAQVRPLLSASRTTVVLVTSRNELTSLVMTDGAQPLSLNVLPVEQARELLAQRLGPDRVAAEPAATTELIELCARLPLALVITAARAAGHASFPLAALASELRRARSLLDALTTGEDETDVRGVFSWSYQQLCPAGARMFRLLSLHPGPDITAEAAAGLAAVTPAEARRALRELAGGHLLTEMAPGRYAFHDLLRTYATEQAETTDDPQARHAATGRLLDHYLYTGHAACLQLNPGRERISLPALQPGVTPEQLTSHAEALSWFEAEHHVLLSAVTLAASAGFGTHAWQLPWTMSDFLDRRGHWHDWMAAQHIALDAAKREGDILGQAAAHRLLAHACGRFGDYGQARANLMQCVGLCRQAGNGYIEARAHLSLCWVFAQEGRKADSLRHAEQANSLSEVFSDEIIQASALNNLGCCYLRLDDPGRARRFFRRSLDLHRRIGNSHGQAHTWSSLGDLEQKLGRRTEAAVCYQRSINLFRECGDSYHEAQTLTHLGHAVHAADDPETARRAWQQALSILEDLDHPDARKVQLAIDLKLQPQTGQTASA